MPVRSLTGLLVLICPAILSAQSPRFEAGLQGLALLTDHGYVGGGPWIGWRPASHLRLGLLTTTGTRGRSLAGRLEGAVHLLVDPDRQHGATVYGTIGLALDLSHGTREYLLAGLGLEGTPGRRGGWVIEAGAGGGWRVSAGYRWRWGMRRR